ncbi:MAG: hypothetical protein ACR2HC_10570 [Thermoleophilaceae bacterium]
MSSGEQFWRNRLRWRFRGATQWPAFLVATVLDGLILYALPPLATHDLNPVDGILIATFGNLILLGAAAPFLAKRLMRRRAVAMAGGEVLEPERAQTDREVLQDRVASLLLAAGVVATLVSGLANRPVIVSETNATEEVGRQLEIYVKRSDSAELRRNLETANTTRLGDGYFRACIARDDRRRYMCLFVDTNKDPTDVRRDPSTESNAQVVGPKDR